MTNKILHIRDTVLRHLEVTTTDCNSKSRKRETVEARQIAHYFAKGIVKNASLFMIGSLIGGKDHATVIHSIKTVNNLIQTDKSYSDKIRTIDRKIKRSYVSNSTLLDLYDQRCMNTFAINDIF